MDLMGLWESGTMPRVEDFTGSQEVGHRVVPAIEDRWEPWVGKEVTLPHMHGARSRDGLLDKHGRPLRMFLTGRAFLRGGVGMHGPRISVQIEVPDYLIHPYGRAGHEASDYRHQLATALYLTGATWEDVYGRSYITNRVLKDARGRRALR